MSKQKLLAKFKETYLCHNYFIRLVFAIILIFFIFYKVNILETIKVFKQLNYLILIPLLLYIPGIMLSALKWEIILSKQASFFKLLRIYWISSFFNNFLPSTIGGDSYRIMKLKKQIGALRIINSVFQDRISGFVALVLIANFLSFIIFSKLGYDFVSFMPMLILISLIIFYLFIYLCKPKENSLVHKAVQIFKLSKSNIFYLLIISIVYISLGAFSLWIYYIMFGININFIIVLFFYCLIQIINVIPISINALGINEGAMIYFFSLVGVSPEISLSIALLSRIVMLFQTSIGGLIYLFEK